MSMSMSGVRRLFCDYCRDSTEFELSDGFYHCGQCGSQSQDLICTAADDDDLVEDQNRASLYSHIIQRRRVSPAEPDDGPRDFGPGVRLDPVTVGDGIRMRYVRGLQLILQKQCQVLVDRFGVSLIVCGVASRIWLRYVAVSGVFKDNWISSQIAAQGRETNEKSKKSHAQLIRRALRKTIPLYSTISISFLSCLIAREPILPTDITHWALNSQFPYLSVFLQLENNLSASCPLSSRALFRPVVLLSSWQLESASSEIAERIALQLPPVNFHGLSRRFLREVGLPEGEILPEASRVFEWLLPAEMWVSGNRYAIPTRVSVMAVLVISLRILYGVNGQGVWEMSLEKDLKRGNNENGNHEMEVDNNNMESGFCATDLLRILEASFEKIEVKRDYTNGLDSYIKYCKDVVFPGIAATNDEQAFIDRFWKFYSNNEDNNDNNKGETTNSDHTNINGKRPSDEIDSENKQLKSPKNSSCDSSKIKAIEKMRLEMEENGFTYLTPITKRKNKGYVTYKRVQLNRELAYVAHADYYIILRAFARLARVDVRVMHSSVLELERKLAWIEERISNCFSNVSKDHRLVENREMEVDSD
ncbi:hypothetical protein LUZ60_006188 [Juncus effusus]|nr:hypothetical protein LUZ60_006188 [Juncus effusus]